VIKGPELAQENTWPSAKRPGIEALIWPWLFADGHGTFRGPRRVNEPQNNQLLPWVQHLLKLDGRAYAEEHGFIAAMYRNHLDGRIANKVTAFMTKEHAEATRGDMVSAIQSGTGEIFRKMTCYMKTIPGSDAFLLDMKHQAVAVYRSLLLMEQRTPILFSTTSAAEQCSLFTQLGLELLSNPPVGLEGPPCLLDADAGGDWARRFQRTSVDPVAVQMLTYEQLFSLRRLRHAYFCVDDFVTGNE